MNLDRVIAVRNNKTIYRDGDKCIKVFHEGYSKADILNEALNQAKMEESGLSIPKVLEVTNVDGNWAIVFEYVKGKTLDEIYENFSSRMEANWEIAKQTVGEGAAVKYELLSRVEYEGNMYESFKEEIIAKYGIPYDAFGICYEVKVMKATVGKLKEDLATQFYHVIQIDDQWYVAEVLTEMPIL